jgi:hypothetical protein
MTTAILYDLFIQHGFKIDEQIAPYLVNSPSAVTFRVWGEVVNDLIRALDARGYATHCVNPIPVASWPDTHRLVAVKKP